MQEFLVDVYINKQKMDGVILILEDVNRHVFLNTQQLTDWGILIPDVKTLKIEGNNYIDITNLPGSDYQFSQTALSLTIDLPAKDFKKNIVPESGINPTIIRPQQSGMYMNYDVSVIHNELQDQETAAGTTDFTYFNRYGVGNAEFLIQNPGQQTFNSDEFVETDDEDETSIQPNTIVRLDTTWTLDKPEDMSTWRFGDSITGTSIWSGAVRFGGIQYATNFNTQPNFVTFPLPAVEGEAVVPTTVNFFINNQLQQTNDVNEGPFDIQGVPVITGGGDLVVQTTDILGRQTTITVPYYTSPSLLKPGLTDFSYEIGAVRNNYGLVSNDYGPMMLVGTWQEGITNQLTAGWHSELLTDQQTLGISSAYAIGKFGILSLSTAASHASRGEGALAQIGFQRQTSLSSFGGQIITTTPEFMQLGLDDDELAPSLTTQLYASYNPVKIGSFAVSYTEREGRSEDDIGLVTLSYSRNLFKNIYLMLSAVKTVQGDADNQLYLSLSWSPKPSYAAAVTAGNQTGGSEGNIMFSKNLPAGNGYGYLLQASPDEDDRLQANYYLNTNYGSYTARASRVDETNNLELDATGGIVHFADDTFFTRPVDDSFIVVEVPGFENVRVYESNQLITTTDKKGNAFIPYALPYQKNNITINPEDLPLNTEIGTTDLNSYPYYKSGAVVKFPVYLTQAIELNLMNDNHQPLPVGTSIDIEGANTSNVVGYEGLVYIQNRIQQKTLKGRAHLANNKTCLFTATIPVSNDSLINLGNITCH